MQAGDDIDITVIIPTYRRTSQLAEAIQSASAQDGAKVEIIVIDDCPNGTARAVADAFPDARLRYLKNPEPSQGRPAIVRNIGWPLARGTFIHFLDDDDVVPAGHYKRALAAFSNNPDVSVVFGNIEPFGIDADALTHEIRYFRTAKRRAKLLSRFGKRLAFSSWLHFAPTFTVCSSAIVRKDCVAAISGFDPKIELCEDVDFIARAILHGGAIMIDRTSVHYRIHTSLMHNKSDMSAKLRRSYRRMQQRYKERFGSAGYFLAKSLIVILRRLPA
jgi:glycosyltransferase involved in cell wall biosynthesis